MHGVDPAFSGSMRLSYKKKIPDEVLWFRVRPVFVYRAAGVRPSLS